MKIYIAYPILEQPYGGANQFLRALKNKFVENNVYTKEPSQSDVILFNGHHEVNLVHHLKNKFPNKKFVHRTDGLQKLYNKPDDKRQDITFEVNRLFADATIFQTQWALDKHIEYGMKITSLNEVILNSVNDKIFNQIEKKQKNNKVKLVCTSWSTNKNKGFETYKFLDENLDFNKYSFDFVGNDPGIKYNNINMLGPHSTKEVASFLRNSDIFITSTKHDCCSNSLLEALFSGLPCVALNSGGNTEIVKKGGILYNSTNEIIESIEQVSNNINMYKANIQVETIDQISEKYINFFRKVLNV